MRVKELIKVLERVPDDSLIVVSSEYSTLNIVSYIDEVSYQHECMLVGTKNSPLVYVYIGKKGNGNIKDLYNEEQITLGLEFYGK